MKKLLKRKAFLLGMLMSLAVAGITFTTQSCGNTTKNDSTEKTELPAVKKAKEDAKCGEGKCGEGKCGSKEVKEEKASDSKCGEGKCGDGKCGNGK